mgnify:CR=1 FL=1
MIKKIMSPQSTIFPVLVLILAMVSIQSGASLAKNLFPVAGAMGTSALRLFFAAIILGAIWKPWKSTFQKADLKELIFYGGSLGLMNLFFYLAIARIPLGIAVAIEFTGPLTITVLSSKKLLDYFWVLLASAGVLLILPLGDIQNAIDGLGIFLAFLAAFFWALYIHFGVRAGKDHSSGVVSAVGMIVAAIIVVPVGIVAQGVSFLSWSILPFGLGVALFSSAIPYSLEMYSLKRIPKKEFGILLSLEPVCAALSGLFFLQERLSLVQCMAIALIIFASIGVSISSTKKKITPQELDSL